MKRDPMTTKERLKWYTEFIEEASKLGTVDRSILQRKHGVVEMLRLETNADAEGAAYAYMQVQKRDQERGGSMEKDMERIERDAVLAGMTPEAGQQFAAWFKAFCGSVGSANPFRELREITNNAMLACDSDADPAEVMAVLQNGNDRVIEMVEECLKQGPETLEVSDACREVTEFLSDLAKAYEKKVMSKMLDGGN